LLGFRLAIIAPRIADPTDGITPTDKWLEISETGH
jgi:hypothetical protein